MEFSIHKVENGQRYDMFRASERMAKLKLRMIGAPQAASIFWCRVSMPGEEQPKPHRHRHRFYELQYCLVGSCSLEINHQQHQLDTGRLLLISPGSYHAISQYTQDCAKFVMAFSFPEETLNPDLDYIKKAVEHNTQHTLWGTQWMQQLIDNMLFEADQGEPGFVRNITASMEMLFVQLARSFQPAAPVYFYEMRKNDHEGIVAMVKHYVEYNLANEIGLYEISREVGVSSKQLNRILQKNCQKTFAGMLSEARLSKAQQLLEDTDLSLLEIAEQIGFSNEYNFGRFFKKLDGMSPGRYRKDIRHI